MSRGQENGPGESFILMKIQGRSVMTLRVWALISSKPLARGLGSTWWLEEMKRCTKRRS